MNNWFVISLILGLQVLALGLGVLVGLYFKRVKVAIKSKVEQRVKSQIEKQYFAQLWMQMWNQMGPQVWDETGNKIGATLQMSILNQNPLPIPPVPQPLPLNPPQIGTSTPITVTPEIVK